MVRRDAGRPRGDAVVEAVLRATVEELAVAGPEGLSVERVARRAEVNKTSVYRRWPSREDLIAAALLRFAETVGGQADQGSLRADLLAVVTTVGGFLGRAEGRALARAAVAESSASALASLAAERLRRQAEEVLPMVARARERGEWGKHADADQVVAMLVGAVLHRVLLERQEVSPAWAESLVDLLVNGVAPRPDC